MASGQRIHRRQRKNVGAKKSLPVWRRTFLGVFVFLVAGLIAWKIVLPRLISSPALLSSSPAATSGLLASNTSPLTDPSHPPCSKYFEPPQVAREETTVSVDLTQKDGNPAFLEFLVIPADQPNLLEDGKVKAARDLQGGNRVYMEGGKIGLIQSVETELYTPEPIKTDKNGNGFRRVIGKSKRWTETILKIHTPTEVIDTTPEHPFYVGGQWIEAKNLKPGDEIKGKDGPIRVTKIETVKEPQFVYNLLVEGAHNFYVGNGGLLAHNCTPEILKVAQKIPKYTGAQGEKTSGILLINGKEVPLISGVQGPAQQVPNLLRGWNRPGKPTILAHVEGHAAATMYLENASEATLVLNNVPCSGPLGCDLQLENMVPPGAALKVIVPEGWSAKDPEGFIKTYTGR
jgi:hypothetical protein